MKVVSLIAMILVSTLALSMVACGGNTQGTENKGTENNGTEISGVQDDGIGEVVPLTENEMGVIMVSGFSPNIMSMVMSGQTDSWFALKEKLDDKRYNCISDILKSIKS